MKLNAGLSATMRASAALAFVLFIQSVFSVANAAPAQKKDPGTLFIQTSKVLGRCHLLVSKSGMRLTLIDKNVALIAHAPDWRFSMINLGEHTYFTSEAGNFKAFSTLTVSIYRPCDTGVLKAAKSEKAMLNGIACRKISMTGEPAFKEHDPNWRKLLLHSAEYWVTATSLPPSIVRGIQELYVLPTDKDLPLQLITINNKFKRSKELALLQIRQIETSPEYFKVPANFKAVKKTEDVLQDKHTEGFFDVLE